MDYISNHTMDPFISSGKFINEAILGSLGRSVLSRSRGLYIAQSRSYSCTLGPKGLVAFMYLEPNGKPAYHNRFGSLGTWSVNARKLEYDCPPTPKPVEEGKPTYIVPGPYSNFLESTALYSLEAPMQFFRL